jgi:hypothetical protein
MEGEAWLANLIPEIPLASADCYFATLLLCSFAPLLETMKIVDNLSS